MRKRTYPLIPLRDIVIFPHMMVTLFVGREKSLTALNKIVAKDHKALFVAQKDSSVEDPAVEDLFDVGTIGVISQVISLPDGTVKVLVEGVERVHVKNVQQKEDFFESEVHPLHEDYGDSDSIQALLSTLKSEFRDYATSSKKVTPEVLENVLSIRDPVEIADAVTIHLSLSISEKQEVLMTSSVEKRMERLVYFIQRVVEAVKAEDGIRGRIRDQMEKSHREYYLNEQLKAIQKELRGESSENELDAIEKRIHNKSFPKSAKERALQELRKLRLMSPMSAEASVVRNYLEWLLDLPWQDYTQTHVDLIKAKQVLDQAHYGLDKVKERILEFLAVQKRSTEIKGQIICLVGPPGVGKTSLAKSIASAIGRNYIRISLGGVRDESEIRGHRRTYIGAMPGKIIQTMKRAKSSNPLILLDEIDKMGSDMRGDPASAMLEVLDPEQNSAFNDHYLEVDYDLSQVMFIATANTLDIPVALRDRMEIIQLEGYTEDEKVQIAQRHLVKKQKKDNALQPEEMSLSESAIRQTIRLYTRESGVRQLEREIASISRKVLKKILIETDCSSVSVSARTLGKFLGVPKFSYGQSEKHAQIGIATGLAWTQFGGDLLIIEAVKAHGKGTVITTGKLGDVMKESIHAALSYLRSRAKLYSIDPLSFKETDFHIHVPEGATPKDGPSAGITICLSLFSLVKGIPIKPHVAMTGEISLRGKVLPIGGLKEKLLAAQRGGIQMVLIPRENEKDLADVPASITDSLSIKAVDSVDDVFRYALTEWPVKSLSSPKTFEESAFQ